MSADIDLLFDKAQTALSAYTAEPFEDLEGNRYQPPAKLSARQSFAIGSMFASAMAEGEVARISSLSEAVAYADTGFQAMISQVWELVYRYGDKPIDPHEGDILDRFELTELMKALLPMVKVALPALRQAVKMSASSKAE